MATTAGNNANGGGGNDGNGGNQNNNAPPPLQWSCENLLAAVTAVLHPMMAAGDLVIDPYTGLPEGFSWKQVGAYFLPSFADLRTASLKCRKQYFAHSLPNLVPVAAEPFTAKEDEVIRRGRRLGKGWTDIARMIFEDLGRTRSPEAVYRW